MQTIETALPADPEEKTILYDSRTYEKLLGLQKAL